MNVEKIVIDCANNVAEATGNDRAGSIGSDTRLFGGDGVFDSMDLVMLTIEIEQMILECCAKSVVLASEKAMSKTVSPFRTVKSMSNYIEELISEA